MGVVGLSFKNTVMKGLARLAAPHAYRSIGVDILSKQAWLTKTCHWSEEQREQWRLGGLGDELAVHPILTENLFKSNRDRITSSKHNGKLKLVWVEFDQKDEAPPRRRTAEAHAA